MEKFVLIALFAFTFFLQSEGAHKNDCSYYNFHAVSGQRNVLFINETIENECIAWVEFKPEDNNFGNLKEYYQKMNDLCSSFLPDGKAYGIRLGERKNLILDKSITFPTAKFQGIKANDKSTYTYLLNMWVYRTFSNESRDFTHTYGTISSDVNVTIPVINDTSACPIYFKKTINFKCEEIHKIILRQEMETPQCFTLTQNAMAFDLRKCLNLTIDTPSEHLFIPCKHEGLSVRCKKWDFDAKRCKKCSPGFTGNLCEQDIDECKSLKICGGCGKCTNHKGGYTCHCNPGYIGEYCEQIDYCASNPCPKNSICKNKLNSYGCICSEENIGEHCSINIEEETEKTAAMYNFFIVIGTTLLIPVTFFMTTLFYCSQGKIQC
ncbi:Uncharacterized protein T10_10761 [Trichinella papuae]|uniref:EGF-like domain-containing protein n=1 Tax=Trichinella papuae TaxID=268474 RepID=A0A0V1N6N4_9BILA|nr:Uncharacterized protein T10_10761 [Trichinella papuae]